MQIARRFTTAGQDPYAAVGFRTATSEIRNPDGSVVFQAEGIEVPAEWSQVAADILAQKYYRKAGVPMALEPVPEEGVPAWLWRRRADKSALGAPSENARFGGETDARQVFDRMAGTWTYWGWKGGYFDSEADAAAFYDEIRLMLARRDGRAEFAAMVQYRASLGLWHRRPGAGPLVCRLPHRRIDPIGERLRAPAAACLLYPECRRRSRRPGRDHGSVREARIFKYGSGSGSNFRNCAARASGSQAAAAPPGLMSFLRIGDRAAGAIKSGGTTRRAAKMVIVDIDHPDIEAFIDWKVVEEEKVAALVAGSNSRHAI